MAAKTVYVFKCNGNCACVAHCDVDYRTSPLKLACPRCRKVMTYWYSYEEK